ncbi:hypothetical protein ACX8XP_15150 [Calditrichota bacterium LG25]
MVPNDSLFYYEWYHNKEDSYVLVRSGYGLNSVYSDGHYGQKWNYFVRVTGDNFSVMSDTLFNVGKDEINYPIEVTLLAKNDQSENIEISVWEYTNPRWFRKHHTGINIKASFFNNETKTLWTNTEIIQDIQERFYKWSTHYDPFLNYHGFDIDSTINEIETNTKRVFIAKVTKKILSNLTGTIQLGLKDPWYEDGSVLGGVVQNRPYTPIYHHYNDSIIIDLNSNHKGVFLEQPYTGNNPHYSVKADARQTFTAHGQQITGYFLGWEGTDVTFQYADQQETPLVFHADGAEARAVYKGHLASSAAGATGYNNGRRAS